MKVHLLFAAAFAAALVLPAPAALAQHQHADAVKGSGKLPAGWEMRLDNPKAATTDLSFAPMGGGIHAMTGPAAIFYRPDTAKSGGAYQVQATFQQVAPSAMPEAYGLIFGGADLSGPNQKYTYFLIRQDGRFLIKRRAGGSTPTVADWTDHPAINKTAGTTRGTNTLAVAVTADTVRFMVNGTQVATAPASAVDTAGMAGLRINHSLNVHVEGFGVK